MEPFRLDRQAKVFLAVLIASATTDGPIQVGKAARHAKIQSPEYIEAVEAVHTRVTDGPFQSIRNAPTPGCARSSRLGSKRGVKHETVKRGEESRSPGKARRIWRRSS
jgi:hypothetical protein